RDEGFLAPGAQVAPGDHPLESGERAALLDGLGLCRPARCVSHAVSLLHREHAACPPHPPAGTFSPWGKRTMSPPPLSFPPPGRRLPEGPDEGAISAFSVP